MGRGKLAIELITREKTRSETFQKRKKSLFKKAAELSILCDVKICAIINWFQDNDPSKACSETWPEKSSEVARIIANYEAKSLTQLRSTGSNNRALSVDKMVIKAKFPDWDQRINCFSGEQLFELLHVIDRKILVVDQQLNAFLMMQAHQISGVDQYSGPEQLINYTTSTSQPEYGNSGFDWVSEYPETASNLGVLDSEILHLQMQPQMDFQTPLIDYPTAVTPLQTWHPPAFLPNPPSIPRMPFLPPCQTPWPDLINGDQYQMMDDDCEEPIFNHEWLL